MDFDGRSDASFFSALSLKVNSRKKLTITFFSLMIFSCVTLLFEILSCSLDQFVTYSVKDRVTAPTEDGGTTLLIPQISVSIGFITACIGHQCVSRSDAAIPSSFATSEALFPVVSSDIVVAYASVRRYFNVGFNFAEACATQSTVEVSSNISKLALAAQILSIILLFCAVLCCASILVQLRSRTSLYYSIDWSDGIIESFIVLEELESLLNVLLIESERHWHSVMGLYATVLLNFFASLTVMCSFLGLFMRPGCTNGFCSSFEEAIHVLEDQDGMDPIAFTCSRGNSFKLSIVGYALSTVLAIATVCLFIFLFFDAKRRQVQEYIAHLLENREIKQFQLASTTKKKHLNPLSESLNTMMQSRILFSEEYCSPQHKRYLLPKKDLSAKPSFAPSEDGDNELRKLAKKEAYEERNVTTSEINRVYAVGQGNETNESIVSRGSSENRSSHAVLPEAPSQEETSVKMVELFLLEEADRSEIYRAAKMDLFRRIRRMERMENLPGLHASISSWKSALLNEGTTALPLFQMDAFSSVSNPLQGGSNSEFVDAVAGDSVLEASYRGRRSRI